MENKIEVIKHILELLPTMEEGLMYIQAQNKEAKFEAGLNVLASFTEAIRSIDDSVQAVLLDLPANTIEKKSEEVENIQNLLMDLYGEKHWERALEVFEEQLIPAFHDWRAEVVKALK